MESKRIRVSQIHLGGLAYSKYEGKANSVAESVGVDMHSVPGTWTANQKMTQEGSGVVNERVSTFLNCSNGKVYAFSGSSGKIWERSLLGVWSLVYTTTANATPITYQTTRGIRGVAMIAGMLGQSILGVANINKNTSKEISGTAYIGAYPVSAMSAIEFEGYIYWTTQNNLHRIAINGTSDWNANVQSHWQTFINKDPQYHPMFVMDNRLYIGDGNYVHQVYLSNYTEIALDILSYHRITTINKYDNDLTVGTISNNGIGKSTYYRWNRWSVSWSIEDDIEEVGVNSIIPMDNYAMINAGKNGNIYAYNGGQLEMYAQIPGTHTPTSEVVIYSNSVAMLNGMPMFGVSNVSGTAVKAGIYSMYTRNPNVYPRVMNLEYTISGGQTDGVEITAMVTKGKELFVAWTRSGVSGIDKLDTANKKDGAYIATRVAYLDRNIQVSLKGLTVNYVSLPTGTSVEVYMRADYADSWGTALTGTLDTKRKQYQFSIRQVANVYEWKVVLRASGNTAPVIDEINIEFV